MRNIGESGARTLAFSSIVIANLSLILTNRSWSETFLTTIRRPNRAFWLVLGGALLFLTLVLTVPALLDLFHFSPPLILPISGFRSGREFSVSCGSRYIKRGRNGRTLRAAGLSDNYCVL